MYQIYKVEPYDTLEIIANKFNTTIEDLIKINDIDNSLPMIIGMSIIVPKNNNKYLTYTVKKGDNLYSIGRKYNISSDDLAFINGLDKDDYIYEGQEILVPKETIYIIKENESIDDVLQKTGITISDLISYNEKIYLQPEQIIFYKKEKKN